MANHDSLYNLRSQSQIYLNELSERLNAILNILEDHLNNFQEQLGQLNVNFLESLHIFLLKPILKILVIFCYAEEINLYRWLIDHIDQFPTDITLVISKLLEGKVEAKPLINCSTLKEVSHTYTFFFIYIFYH